MFTFLGGKWSAAKHYGPPRRDLVIEPFAGSAGYSLYHEPRKVLLVERNPLIAGIWRYLIQVKPSEILALPDDFDHVDEIHAPQEARWLIGMWIGKGRSEPGLRRSVWGKQYASSPNCKVWGPAVRARLACQVERIRHWKIRENSYEDLKNPHAHWFIDPPYESTQGRAYRYDQIDYKMLGDWCRARRGFVQVCEAQSAIWLPFVPFRLARGMGGKYRSGVSAEAICQLYEGAVYPRGARA